VARFSHDKQSVVDDGDYLSVVVGEPIVRIAPESPGLSWRGSRRRALHDLLKSGRDHPWDQHIDGSFALFGIDQRTGAGIALTDLFAFIPVFTSTDREGAAVAGTHVDAVARAAGRHDDIDAVSAADLVTTLVCTFPFSLFHGVEQFPPAASRRFHAPRWEAAARTYWYPFEDNPYPSPRAAATALRDALLADLGTTCDGLDDVGVLLSGGEDSRAVVAAVPANVHVRGFIYAERENREVRVARAAARAYGVDLVLGRRAPDHYVDGLETVAGLMGSAKLFMDVHGWGFHDRLGIRHLPVVLGGLSGDALLKAYYAYEEALPIPVEHFPGLRADLIRAVTERHLRYRERLSAIRPRSAGEWYRLWPAAMRKHAGNLHGNRRLFASHEPFHANAITRLAAAAPQAWKHHRKLFQQALRPLFRRSWYVPHARWRFPYFGWYANLPLAAGLRIGRGIRDLAAGELGARQGPWPKWSDVTRSPAAQAKWRAYPVAQSPLAEIFDSSVHGNADAPRWPALRQLMLLQLTYLSYR
jgi:asparagine synthetase B (glutamine-hydrolysing)